MLNFEYEIRLNDENRPCVYIPDTYQDKPEDKFMAFELTRYVIGNMLNLRGNELPEGERNAVQKTLENLEILSDELALILKKEMEVMGEIALSTYREYHVTVDTIEDRDKLKYVGFIHKGKIYKRAIGLKVLVLKDMNVYELVDGIDNENWRKV